MIFVLPFIPLAFFAGYLLAKRRPRPIVKKQRANTFPNLREVQNFLNYDGTEQE